MVPYNIFMEESMRFVVVEKEEQLSYVKANLPDADYWALKSLD